MNRVILADDQAIFRAGAARVLALEPDMRIVAQVEQGARLISAVAAHRSSVVVFAASLVRDLAATLEQVREAGSFAVLIAEKGEPLTEPALNKASALIGRSISGPELVECVRRAGRGERSATRGNVTEMQPHDAVGTRVRDRLTPKEMQIVALIVQGRKNKDIAHQLNTKEQVIKNYLRSIYDKIGVSDRLELALFTLHHRVLAEAAARAGTLIQLKSA